jgi:uncharacterized membrane protein YphA (DoxX/SURF4 family)
MKIASTIARYLLGLMFTVFGLNGFLHFLKMPPPSSPLAMQFMTVMSDSHYLMLVFAFQLLAGILLLSGRYIPLALTILAPIIVNIWMYHLTMDPAGIGPGVVATILWILVFLPVRANFVGLFQPKPEPPRP